MSTTVELGKATAEIARLRAGIEALADDLASEGQEAAAYVNRAHHSEIHEVMTEARIYPRIAADLRQLLDES